MKLIIATVAVVLAVAIWREAGKPIHYSYGGRQ